MPSHTEFKIFHWIFQIGLIRWFASIVIYNGMRPWISLTPETFDISYYNRTAGSKAIIKWLETSTNDGLLHKLSKLFVNYNTRDKCWGGWGCWGCCVDEYEKNKVEELQVPGVVVGAVDVTTETTRHTQVDCSDRPSSNRPASNRMLAVSGDAR